MNQELRIKNFRSRFTKRCFNLSHAEQGEASSLGRSFTSLQDDNKKERQRGVTLVELLLYMGIFSILLMVLVQLFSTIVNVSLEAQATSAVSQDGRFILNRIIYDVRRADATTITSPSTSQYGVQNPTIKVLQFTTTDGTTYKYWLSGGNLKLDNLTASPNTSDQLNSVGTTVSNLSFVRLKSSATTNPENTISVSFTLTSTTVRQGNRPETGNFQTTVGTR